MYTERIAANSIRLAKVVKAHPSSHAVDLVFLDDGARMAGAQAMSHHASNNSGVVDLPAPAEPESEEERWRPKLANPYCDDDKRDMVAVVAMVGMQAVVLGYLFPQVSEMNQPEGQHTRIDRHHSDFVQTTEETANYSLKHPSGTFLNIGDGEPPVLDGKDHDQVYKTRRNTSRAASVTAKAGDAIAVVCHDGNIYLNCT